MMRASTIMMPRAAFAGPTVSLRNPKDSKGKSFDSSLVTVTQARLCWASWKWEQSFFQVTLHQNGSLGGWWVRIWIGAGWEPSCAEECLDLSQNIIHLSGEQSLTVDSLDCGNWRKCYQTCYPADGLFSAVLMWHYLHVADPSCFLWHESY
jgi:hypothetical protein